MSTDNPAGSNDISLADEDRVRQVLVNSVPGLWDVVNNRTRLIVGEHHAACVKRD